MKISFIKEKEELQKERDRLTEELKRKYICLFGFLEYKYRILFYLPVHLLLQAACLCMLFNLVHKNS